jgi:hypothetical protein
MRLKVRNAAGNYEILQCDECLEHDQWEIYLVEGAKTAYMCRCCSNTTNFLINAETITISGETLMDKTNILNKLLGLAEKKVYEIKEEIQGWMIIRDEFPDRRSKAIDTEYNLQKELDFWAEVKADVEKRLNVIESLLYLGEE